MKKLLSNTYFDAWKLLLNIDLDVLFNQLQEKEWTPANFKFYTAVSVMSSARIEGEQLEIDSYLKHKLNNVEYLHDLTEKPNDLYHAYEFARDNQLTLRNFFSAHELATMHLLVPHQRGVVRQGNMIIMEQQTNRVQYEAAPAAIVKKEFQNFWNELAVLINRPMDINEVFYYASFIHLVFVKIHPFNDGNGRTARLLEKWFLVTKLGPKAWYIASEYYYYQNLQAYYNNLAVTGLFYDELKYEKGLPFLTMLPQALVVKK